ncbi:MAG TPA: hypothetical protein VF861_16570 [Telluria sp.]
MVALQRDGIAAASMTQAPGARPKVALASFLAGAGSAESLEKAGKELRARRFCCSTLLAGGDYQMLSIDAPNVAADELRTAVRWRLKDLIDFPVDAATIDVLDIPVDKGAAVRPQHSIFAVAARNSLIEQRQKLFARARTDLEAIDIPEMAQRNISALLEPEGRGVAMLSFGEDGGLLTVSWNGELYLSRRIEVTLAQLMEPDHERKHASFDKITLELQRSLDHFERQFSFISVSKLVLAPNASVGLDEYLSSNLYTRVESLDLGDVFDLTAAPELADKALQQRFFLPLGAALRAQARQQLNLFNPAFEQEKKIFAAVRMAQALALLVVGVSALAFYGSQRTAAMQRLADNGARQLELKQARLASVNSDFAPRSKSVDVETQVAEAEIHFAALQRVSGVLERGELGNTKGFAEYFKALARQNVDGLWLTGLSIAGAGTDIGVAGRALDATLLPGYLGRLTREPALQGKTFGSLQINQGAAGKTVGADGKESLAPPAFVEFKLHSTPEGGQP